MYLHTTCLVKQRILVSSEIFWKNPNLLQKNCVGTKQKREFLKSQKNCQHFHSSLRRNLIFRTSSRNYLSSGRWSSCARNFVKKSKTLLNDHFRTTTPSFFLWWRIQSSCLLFEQILEFFLCVLFLKQASQKVGLLVLSCVKCQCHFPGNHSWVFLQKKKTAPIMRKKCRRKIYFYRINLYQVVHNFDE